MPAREAPAGGVFCGQGRLPRAGWLAASNGIFKDGHRPQSWQLLFLLNIHSPFQFNSLSVWKASHLRGSTAVIKYHKQLVVGKDLFHFELHIRVHHQKAKEVREGTQGKHLG